MFTLDKKQQNWQWYLILSLLAFFSFYFAIGAYPLFDNNEGLYASIAKLMLLHKEFIIPHLNCVPYIEKPPLLYWLLSLSFSIFGLNAFAARFVTATSAALLCVMLVYFGKKIKQPQVGIIGGFIFASSIGISIIARMVFFDMLLTFFISGALLCLFYWFESQKVASLRLGYLFLALAILIKGLVAVILVGGSFGLFLILEKDFRKLYQALDPTGIALFLAIVLPWHIAATLQHKGFFWHYIVEEHFLRFLNQREPRDYYHGPIYYYFPRIMIYMFPWSLFVPLIFWRDKNADMAEKKLLRFSWCWLLVPLLFFSLSSAKANYYMIISMPALALMLGIKLKNFSANHFRAFKIWSVVILFLVTLVISIGFFVFTGVVQNDVGIRNFIIFAIIYGVIASIVTVIFIERIEIIVALIAAFIIPLVVITVTYVKVVQDDLSSAAVGTYLTAQVKNESVYIYQDFENVSALSFYAPKCFKIIDTRSNDLYYGAHLPQYKSTFLNREEFLREISNERGCVVVPTKKLQQFYQNIPQIKFALIKKFGRLIVMCKKQ